jgi:hypothetical protein
MTMVDRFLRKLQALHARWIAREREIEVCSRPKNHAGPCNGFPCSSAKAKMAKRVYGPRKKKTAPAKRKKAASSQKKRAAAKKRA